MAETISSLFRLSIIIQRASPRDRFTKALASVKEPFDSSYDIAHVGQKFPRLRTDGCRWLMERLGKAITQRRQYLRYCREHREKKAKLESPQNLDKTNEDHLSSREMLAVAQKPIHLETQSFVSGQNPATSSIPTAATTLRVDQLEVAERLSDDAISKTSLATSVEDNTASNPLRIARLEDVSRGTKTFECPYCRTIQTPKSQSHWR